MPTTTDQLTQAVEWHKSGRLPEAEAVYRDVLAADPNNADALHMLGVLASQRGHTELALSCLSRAISLNPTPAFYHNNLGNVLFQSGRLADAALCYEEALRLDPNYPEAHGNLANTCDRLGRFPDALAHRLEVARLRPELSSSYAELGNTLRIQGMLSEALTCFGQALAIDPDNAEAHMGRAFTLLLAGDLAAGWLEYEWRWKTPCWAARAFTEPLWDGSPLDGRTILIYAESGLAQTVQFARYLPIVAERGGRVVFECQPELAPLMRGMPEVSEVVVAGSPLPPFELQAPLGSLPRILGTTADAIPAQAPYLRTPKRRVRTGTVGISWPGDVTVIEPLFEVPGIRFVTLAETEDLADLADAISDLDLVIAADGVTAHLAGALGVPVWTLLPFTPDWPWMLGRDDSPWYPSMRLFRQPLAGDWAPAVAQVREALLK